MIMILNLNLRLKSYLRECEGREFMKIVGGEGMHFCPKCGKPGYRCMGAGAYICVDYECRTVWSVEEDGKTTIIK